MSDVNKLRDQCKFAHARMAMKDTKHAEQHWPIDRHTFIWFKGIVCDFIILTLEQIIVLNKYCTYTI